MSPIPDAGDIVIIDFDPQAGHEQAGKKPALVLSPKQFNKITGFVWLCPITSQVKGYHFRSGCYRLKKNTRRYSDRSVGVFGCTSPKTAKGGSGQR